MLNSKAVKNGKNSEILKIEVWAGRKGPKNSTKVLRSLYEIHNFIKNKKWEISHFFVIHNKAPFEIDPVREKLAPKWPKSKVPKSDQQNRRFFSQKRENTWFSRIFTFLKLGPGLRKFIQNQNYGKLFCKKFIILVLRLLSVATPFFKVQEYPQSL